MMTIGMTALLALAGLVLPACEGGSHTADDEPARSDGASADGAPVDCTDEVEFDDIFIRSLAVVDDPRAGGLGAWSFGRLASNLAGARDPAEMVREWLGTWEEDVALTTPGGYVEIVPGNPRSVQDILIRPWPRDPASGALDLGGAPFRLLAIVYRPDLVDLARGSGGEVRFVYGGINAAGGAMPFTAAFEYRVPAATREQAAAFAADWYRLSRLETGSPEHLARLQELTDRVTAEESALAQLRTNEAAIDSPWDLREFRLAGGGALALAPTPGAPRIALNGSQALGQLLSDGFTPGEIPLELETGMARIPHGDWFWRPMAGVANQTRHEFAASTCNGCHSRETGTRFLHIRPRDAGELAEVSDFVASSLAAPLEVRDPVSGEVRTFAEQTRRLQELRALACGP